MSEAAFSDRWYRVSDLHVALLPSVRVHKQMIRGHACYILTEPYSQRYFQVSSETYNLLMRLTPRLSVNEIWTKLVEEHPEQAPGQEEVVRILSQLHHANLLYSRSLPDSRNIFDREQRLRRRELWGKLLAFLFVRIPLWDPNRWLGKIRPLTRLVVSLPGAFAWMLVVVMAILMLIPNSAELYQQSQGVLAAKNLLWLYLCLAGLKAVHELAHAMVCKHYGGDVHTMGIMFLVFVPLPYMDATSSWSFRKRRQRILVSSAGMLSELFLAAIAAWVWVHTGEGLIHSLAFNVMLIGSVSSLLFNGNPLLRFDAYFILSDLIDIPNLSQKTSRHWSYLAQRWLMGSKTAVSPALDCRQRLWLVVYGGLSFLYRVLITFLIVLIVFDQIFAVGVLVVFISIGMWVIRPVWKLFGYLMSPQIRQHRHQAIIVTIVIALSINYLIFQIPFPYSIKAPGIVEAVDFHQIFAPASGILSGIRIESGQMVKSGQVLAEFENPDLETELIIISHLIRESSLVLRRSLFDSPADMEPLEQHKKMLEERLADLQQRKTNLTIRAVTDGTWAAPHLTEKQGGWFERGQLLGHLVGEQMFRFTAVVSQEQADELFRRPHHKIGLRLAGQSEKRIEIPPDTMTLIPFQRERLASAALGWGGGGAIATRTDDEGGRHAVEGFFEIRAMIPSLTHHEKNRLIHGLSGQLWVSLEPEPLWHQLRRGVLQLMQKRYGISL